MDNRTWYLAVGTLGAAVFVVVLDAVLGTAFEAPSGFFPFLGGVLGLLGAIAARDLRKNGGEIDDS